MSKKVLVVTGVTAIGYGVRKSSCNKSVVEHRDFALDDMKHTVTIPDEEVKL